MFLTENMTGSSLEEFWLDTQISEVANKLVLTQFQNIAEGKATC